MTEYAIVDRVEADIEELMRRWRSDVRGDHRIVSDDSLSQKELTDHIPQVIQQMCELMRLGQAPQISTTDEARANVYVRVRQGYSGPDLVWELSLLRMVLLDYLAGLQSVTELGMNLTSYAHLTRIINLYIDLELRYAISVYVDLAAGQVTPRDGGA